MRTLHIGLRVTDPADSVRFYSAVGYLVVGRIVDTPIGDLTLLRLPGDAFATIELVHAPSRGAVDLGTGLCHLVVQVESMNPFVRSLERHGISYEPPVLHSDDGMQTCWVTDPDGYRIEVVEWPPWHDLGFSDADFPGEGRLN